ncbi:hypothetical protein JL09_g2987 [Pichia kudriavzevii]|uniref:Uncharacterized protein n=1 Tax=Pichia kudriavzevii TaxID=4909 RepID=A0A099NZ20_PICKU|nr:hypothetical protein JL09_g2987 [Pichia kudriavzevii]
MSNGQSLQGVLDRINLVWPDLLDEDCNPLDIVLPLLNNKSISPTIDEFEELKSQFTKSLQQAVNSNYMAFNDSIGSYGISVETLKQSQDRLSGIKKSMGTIDEMINTPSRILAELNDKRMEHIQTLELLGKINDVKKKLDILQDLIGNRDFSKAGELVNEIMETSNTNRLFEIDALQELQMKLNSNIALLLDGLVTEMNNIIYLKDSTHIEQIQSGSSVKISTHKDLLDFVKCLHNESLEGNEEITAERGNYLTLSKLIKQVQAINKESDCLLKLIEGSEREIKKVIKRCIEEVKKIAVDDTSLNSILKTVENIGKTNKAFNIQVAKSKEDKEDIWRVRKTLLWNSLGWAKKYKPNAMVLPTDVCVPMSKLPELITKAMAMLESADLLATAAGHAGDGNVHVLVIFEPEQVQEAHRCINEMSKMAIELEGTVSGEHGIGVSEKRELLERELGTDTIDLMRTIKYALDKKCILNPDHIFRIDPSENRNPFK